LLRQTAQQRKLEQQRRMDSHEIRGKRKAGAV